jgi:hypothetical protein
MAGLNNRPEIKKNTKRKTNMKNKTTETLSDFLRRTKPNYKTLNEFLTSAQTIAGDHFATLAELKVLCIDRAHGFDVARGYIKDGLVTIDDLTADEMDLCGLAGSGQILINPETRREIKRGSTVYLIDGSNGGKEAVVMAIGFETVALNDADENFLGQFVPGDFGAEFADAPVALSDVPKISLKKTDFVVTDHFFKMASTIPETTAADSSLLCKRGDIVTIARYLGAGGVRVQLCKNGKQFGTSDANVLHLDFDETQRVPLEFILKAINKAVAVRKDTRVESFQTIHDEIAALVNPVLGQFGIFYGTWDVMDHLEHRRVFKLEMPDFRDDKNCAKTSRRGRIKDILFTINQEKATVDAAADSLEVFYASYRIAELRAMRSAAETSIADAERKIREKQSQIHALDLEISGAIGRLADAGTRADG